MTDVRHTNVALITLFEETLDQYEASVPVDSTTLNRFYESSRILRSAIDKLIMSHHQDTLSMMRILTDRIQKGINGAYSDVVLSMVAASTPDLRSRELIYAVPYVICEMINGDSMNLDDAWLQRIEQNHAIHNFLQNYSNSDQQVEKETYSGNVIKSEQSLVALESDDEVYTLLVGYSRYALDFTRNTAQTLVLDVSSDIKPDTTADLSKRLTIDSTVVITPAIGYLVLDKSIGFFDDAAAQITALRCSPQGVITGCDTPIELPGLYYRLALSVTSSDSGVSWRVTEVNILPPKASSSVLASN